ncbi:hypothetical protein JCM18899A_33710 [Nocardioides sp. AN3]
MTPAFGSRRRAEQLDALLEGRLTEAPSAELGALAALVDEVRSLPEVTPRAEFAASLRDRLMAEAPQALAIAPTDSSAASARLTVGGRTAATRPARTSRERRIGVAIAAFSLVGATGVSAMASQGSLPGDTLYPVKRLIEDARASLAMGEDAKADVLLSQARTRLDEAHELSARDEIDTAQVRHTLQDFVDTADHASTLVLADYAAHGDQQSIEELHSFASKSLTSLSSLVGVLPTSLDGTLADVTNTLIAIDQSAAQACPACGGPGITELPSQLVSLLSATTSGLTTPSASTTSAHATAPKGGKRAGRGPTPGTSTASSGSQSNPLTDAAEAVIGGQSGKPSRGPTSVGGAVGSVGGAVGGTVSGAGGAVSGAGSQLPSPVGGVVSGAGGAVSGLGDTVGGVTGGLGNTADGLLGGLTGSPSASPTP